MENRIIKFRAWNGEYMSDASYGDWISFDGVPYTEADRKYDTPNIEIEKAKNYILMQFTGLKDKNGKEIYEGDIVTCETPKYKRKIKGHVYCRYSGEWAVETDEFISQDTDQKKDCVLWNKENIEVIGNIYQNPELLK